MTQFVLASNTVLDSITNLRVVLARLKVPSSVPTLVIGIT